MKLAVPGRECRDREIGCVYLSQQEGGKWIARRREIISAGVITASAEAVEIEYAARVGSPALEIELVVSELVTDFDGVLSFQPRQVISELRAIDGLKAVAGPLHPELRVRDVSRERDIR